MPDVVIFNPSNNRLIDHIASVDPSPYQGRSDVIIYDESSSKQTIEEIRNLVANNPIEYLKKSGEGIVSVMTQNEKFTIDSENEYVDKQTTLEFEIGRVKNDIVVQAIAETISPNLKPDAALNVLIEKMKEITRR